MKILSKKLLFITLLYSFCLSWVQAETYRVTVTNLTPGQIFSPLYAVTHSAGSLFVAGEPAIPELAALAQDADVSGLNSLLSGISQVNEIVTGTGVIPPGQSETIQINADEQNPLFTLVSMLVVTNDAFVAVNGINLFDDDNDVKVINALAYDAGSEANDESCAYIPGPPCGNEFQASNEPGEGFVHIHNGIHGIADLSTSVYDWKNPVARVRIEKMN